MNHSTGIVVRPFTWQDWKALWQLRTAQLAEAGILVDDLPEQPDLSSPYEQDYHRIDQVYLHGAGGFWLAWEGEAPVGHVGGQAFGEGLSSVVELRRMFVLAAYRRRGAGALLVRTLIQHCKQYGVQVVELWTSAKGPGKWLYASLGFTAVDQPDPRFGAISFPPGEIRMRLDMNDQQHH